jgi:hypothetical protein
MMRDEDVQPALERAARAKQILEDPLVTAAVTDVRAAIIAAWASTSSRDAEERERAWLMLQALDRVIGALRKHVETGKVAKHSLGDKSSLRKSLGL